MDSSGTIQLAGSRVTVDGAEVKLRGGKISKVTPGAAQPKEVQVRQLAGSTAEFTFAEFTLVDGEGNPIVNEPFQVEMPDGVRRGTTDGSGYAKVPGSREGTCKVTFTRLGPAVGSGGAGGGQPGQRGATRVIDYDGKQGAAFRTRDPVTIRVPGGRMRIAIHLSGGSLEGAEYPVYVLESADGAYKGRLTPSDDLVPGDDWLQLAFVGLLQGKRYTLACEHGPGERQVLFEDAPYESVVDGEHRFQDGVEDQLLGSPEESP
jgi:hypothetical protein